jgi:hypothetical protein
VSDLKGLVIAAEAVVLLVLAAANIVSGQFLGAAVLAGIAVLAAACAWALWPTRSRLIGLAGERPRRAGSSRRPRH